MQGKPATFPIHGASLFFDAESDQYRRRHHIADEIPDESGMMVSMGFTHLRKCARLPEGMDEKTHMDVALSRLRVSVVRLRLRDDRFDDDGTDHDDVLDGTDHDDRDDRYDRDDGEDVSGHLRFDRRERRRYDPA